MADETKLIIKDRLGVDQEYPMRDKMRLNTSDGSKQVYSKGEAVENVEIELDFTNGDQTVEAAEGTLVKSAIIRKPAGLIPENIPSGVTIAGIEGEYIGVGENGPQLYSPTISELSGSGSQYLTITNPMDMNGVFANTVKLCVGESIIPTDELYSGGIDGATATIYAKDLTMPEELNVLTDVLGARLSGTGFNVSEAAVTLADISILRITYQLTNMDISPKDPCAFLNDSIQFQLTPAESYYLPKTLSVSNGVYDRDTGVLTVSFKQLLDTGYVIAVEASDKTWLKDTPTVTLDDNTAQMTIVFPTNATGARITINNEIVVEVTREADSDSITVDLSEQLADIEYCPISVVATASDYHDSDSVELRYMPALVDINIAENSVANLGTGGSAYNATLANSGALSGGKFVVNGSGSLTIPADFMYGSDLNWTVAFRVDSWTPKTSVAYGRFARGNNDAPSLFYAYSSNKSVLFKLTQGTVFKANCMYCDSAKAVPWDGASGALCVTIPRSTPTIIVFARSAWMTSMYIDGACVATVYGTNYSGTYLASKFSLGNDVSGNSYNMSSMECSMLKAWDRKLTLAEIKNIK